MEKTSGIVRSEAWNKIYEIVKQIPRKEVRGDAVDAPSASTSIEALFLKLLLKNVSKRRELLIAFQTYQMHNNKGHSVNTIERSVDEFIKSDDYVL